MWEESNHKIEYDWDRFNIFTVWNPSTHQTTILAFDLPDARINQMRSLLLDGLQKSEMNDPFWMYPRLLDDVVSLQDESVWSVRHLVRAIEKRRTEEKPQGDGPDYVYLHDTARHAIHVLETLELGANTVESILAHHKRVTGVMGIISGTEENLSSGLVVGRLLFYQDMIRNLRSRASSNRARLQNEIQLVFNLVSQQEARTSVEIGRAARSDSAAMRTIAFITLTFLPPTFISAVFSMSFFNYDQATGIWAVSDDFWLFWAVSVPVTIFTALLWIVWSRLFPVSTSCSGTQGQAQVTTGSRNKLFGLIRMLSIKDRGGSFTSTIQEPGQLA